VAAERRQRDPTIKTDRSLSGDSSYVAEFVNTPIRLEDVAIELSDKEATMLDGLRLPVYGADDGAALRGHPVHVVGGKFLGAAKGGAPAIGDTKAQGGGALGSKLNGLREDVALDESERSRRFERPLSTR
jgi:hypothetical protein